MVRQWAFDENTSEPEQDWDILIHHLPYEALYAELAGDNTCPKADYFLELLYFTVGYAMRHMETDEQTARIQYVVEQSKSSKAYLLKLFRDNVRMLRLNPELFQYEDWCAGKLARESRQYL